ncbi:hypothetical protein BST85_08710 [Aureitalea marina]|uniref:Tetratricopeptide repeat protein n=2 Tax=Aureitalea marina TaxID=930804 RepID=A0A2S7KQQ8_9FLAO|nr:hypothetical protein BST85_08710 [Aureitalea marina]
MRYLTCFMLIMASALHAQNPFDRAVILFEDAQYEEAGSLFQSHLKNYPKDAKTREYLGDIAAYQKDWDGALEWYGPLVEENDQSANYHYKYGGSLAMKALEVNKFKALGYISDIKYHFGKAAELDSSHIDVRWALVEFYMQLPGIIGGSERKSKSYADQLMKISPVDGHLSHGYIAEYSDRPKDAEYHYKKAIDIGGSMLTYEKLTSFYENNDRPNEAINNATRSLEIHQRNQLNYQIGKIAAQYNLKSDLGIQCLHAYIENHSAKDGVPKDWAYFRLAQIHKNKGQKNQALEWIDKALEDRPDFKEARQEKAIILAL